MLEGKKITACENCYRQEASGHLSLRQTSNWTWENGWLNEERLSFEELRGRTIAADYIAPAPAHRMVIVGNQCNLKCRMCNGKNSSRISLGVVEGAMSPGSPGI